MRVINALFSSKNRLSYRALFAFLVCVWLVHGGYIESQDFMWIAIAFVFGETAPKVLSIYSNGGLRLSQTPPSDAEPVSDPY